MTRSFRPALLCALTLLVVSPAFAGEHKIAYDEALSAAQERDALVVIDFFADWCGPCKAFDRDLGDDGSGIAAALQPVVFTSIDAEKGEGIELARKYGVGAFPTYVVMNSDGELIESWAGYGGPEHFVGALETALADPVTFEKKVERFTAEPTAERAKTLGRIAAASGRHATGMDYLLQAEKIDPSTDIAGELLDAAFTRARKDEDYSMQDYVDLAKARILEGEAGAETTLLTTYYVGRVVADEVDHATIKPFLVKSRAAIASGEELSPGLVNEIELQATIVLDGDMEAAVTRKRAMMGEGWQDDPDQLNAFAWWCFENKVNLEEAQQLALQGVELAEPGAARAQILDTAAEICNALGNCDEAIKLIKLALENEPSSEYYAGQLERFEDAAEE